MKVLFLRYYVITLFVLFGLIAGMDRAFWHFYDETPQLSLGDVSQLLREQSTYRRIPLDMMTLPLRQQNELSEHGWISLQDQEEKPVFYFSIDDKTLLEYFPPHHNKDWQWMIWPLAFYTLVAMAMYFFLRPFFRDVQVLRQQVKIFAQTKDDDAFNRNTGAFVRPVVATLRELSTRITELLNLQRDLTATISHEMRTPLARIKMHLAGLDTATDVAHMINDDISEMESLIDEYLLYTQLEYEHPTLDMQWMAMHDLVMPIIDKYSCYSSCSIDYVGCESDLVQVDPTFFGRIVNNLIDNAIKYAKDEIYLSFSINSEGQCRLCVEDNGSGFKKDKNTLSSPYQRADVLDSTKGYGLGLAIVNKAISWHHGQLQLQNSSSYTGAKVVVTWPKYISCNE